MDLLHATSVLGMVARSININVIELSIFSVLAAACEPASALVLWSLCHMPLILIDVMSDVT